jgi:non-canonical purine NTP pyrophosphatase (RdgB/HAM1 family)
MELISLVLATGNPNKLREVSELLGPEFKLYSLKDVGFSGEMPEENGSDYLENAKIKAFAIATEVNMPTLADDSGFEVEALDNQPGIFSARYGNTNDEAEQRGMILEAIKDKSDRRARFVCELALYNPASEALLTSRGVIEGEVSESEKGENGFGYDSIFIPESFSETFAEMKSSDKNAISHRARAINSLRSLLLAREGM